jgi:hypothetical protein
VSDTTSMRFLGRFIRVSLVSREVGGIAADTGTLGKRMGFGPPVPTQEEAVQKARGWFAEYDEELKRLEDKHVSKDTPNGVFTVETDAPIIIFVSTLAYPLPPRKGTSMFHVTSSGDFLANFGDFSATEAEFTAQTDGAKAQFGEMFGTGAVSVKLPKSEGMRLERFLSDAGFTVDIWSELTD